MGAPPGSIAPPPFMQQPAQPSRPSDPFAISAPAVQVQEVRIVLDEKPVDDREAGRSRRMAYIITVAISLVALVIGYGSGSTMTDRVMRNKAIRDAREINVGVTKSAKALALLQKRVNDALTLAGREKRVDFEGLAALRMLKKPLDASVFSRRSYILFEPSIVDKLFDYYNNVNLLWSQVQGHLVKSNNDRAALEQAATEAEAFTSRNYGVVFTQDGDGQVLGALVVLDAPILQGDQIKGWKVKPDTGQASVPRDAYETGDLTANGLFAKIVIPINPQAKGALLPQSLSALREYLQRVQAIRELAEQTVGIQGELLRKLNEIASLDELFTI